MRFDRNEMVAVRGARHDREQLAADRGPLTATKDMSVIVKYFAERPAIDDRFVMIDAGSFFSLECNHGRRSEFNTFYGLLRFFLQRRHLDSCSDRRR